ncbi:hypothetical protein BHC51_09705 [Snodgrassella alvi]|nr:hypothetical protein BHC51_09705 [Snodgrassella alvi]
MAKLLLYTIKTRNIPAIRQQKQRRTELTPKLTTHLQPQIRNILPPSSRFPQQNTCINTAAALQLAIS